MNHPPKILLNCLLFFGVSAISTSAIFVKLSMAPAAIIAAYRLFFATLIIAPGLLFNRNYWQEIKILTPKQWIFGILSGFSLAIHYILWFESLRFTSIASSTVLVTMQPLFAFIGSYFWFGERLRGWGVLGGFLSIVGSMVIGWGDFQIGGTALFGDMLALLGAATITIYFFIGQHLRKRLSLVTYALISYLSSSLFLFGYSLILKYPLMAYSKADWLWFFCLALISTIMGQTILNWLIKWVSTSTISMSILGEPVGTCLLAYFVLGQLVTLQQVMGSIIILTGIFIFMRSQRLEPSRSRKGSDAIPMAPQN